MGLFVTGLSGGWRRSGKQLTHLSAELKARHPDIPWRDITGFSNIAAHGYLVIRPDRLRQILQDDFGPLRAVIEQELGRGAGPRDQRSE